MYGRKDEISMQPALFKVMNRLIPYPVDSYPVDSSKLDEERQVVPYQGHMAA